jgi:hypothetical protein
MYSAPDLNRGYDFLELVYALLAVSMVFAIKGCDVVRSEKRGSGPLSDPKVRGDDVGGRGECPFGGEETKSRAC